MKDNNEKYNNIVRFRHPVSAVHSPMPPLNRAAQFSPFAALTGFDEIIVESARETTPFAEPGSDLADENERILNQLVFGAEKNDCEITYYIPDAEKSGGKYRTACGKITGYDELTGKITLGDKSKINIYAIKNINIIGNNINE